MLTYALIIDTSRDVIRLVWGRDVAEGGWSKTRCTMRLVSPYTLCAFVIIWTLFFLFIARYFLFSAHQSWFAAEEEKFIGELSFKIDNLDARNLRQLNTIYGEIKSVRDSLEELRLCTKHGNCSQPDQELPSLPQPRPARSMATLEPSIAVLVIACNRPTHVTRTLDALFRHRPSAGLFPIIVSQDCAHEPTAQAIGKYDSRLTYIKQPNMTEPHLPTSKKMKNTKALKGYYKISRHYKWALGQVFDQMSYQYAIIVEDDLDLSPDFYSYFSSLRFLLDSDPSVWCISAWNDNGKDGYINRQKNDQLYRTDFFPGLGWMMTKLLWDELKPKWPESFWDDWMREPETRKDRACIRPEVSRTKTFGKEGVSGGQYYKQHLQFITLNSEPVDFATRNLDYLTQDTYEKEFVSRVRALPVLALQDVLSGQRAELTEVQLHYSSNKDFEKTAKQLKIMSDLRGGVPRTAYKGVVSVIYKNRRVHLTSSQPWTGYPTS